MITIGGDDLYVMAMADGQTRYWLSYDLTQSKGTADAKILYQDAEQQAEKVPSTQVTDGLVAYARAHREVFAAKNDQDKQSYHIFEIHFEDQRQNNNFMESFNCTIKARDKSYRGLKKKDTPSLPLFRMYYNHARWHTDLKNKTPGDAAGIKIEERNKMLTIIENMVCAA